MLHHAFLQHPEIVPVIRQCSNHGILHHLFFQVLALDSAGILRYEIVYMFSHMDNTVDADFIALRTSTGATIRVTAGHYLWATRNTTGLGSDLSFATCAAIMKPEDIAVGDYLWVRAVESVEYQIAPTDTLKMSQVVEILTETKMGLYNPHVFSGSIIVDDVAALVFTDVLQPSPLVHQLSTLLARVLYTLLPNTAVANINVAILGMLGKAN